MAKRREEAAKKLLDLFNLHARREDVAAYDCECEVISHCKQCKLLGVDTEHHGDIELESKVIKDEKLKGLMGIRDDLIAENLEKETKIHQLIAANSFKPSLEVVKVDQEALIKKYFQLEGLVKKAKDAIVVEEMECDRTFHMYSEMLQDRMVITTAIDDTSRNLNFINALLINQKSVGGKAKNNEMYEEVFSNALLKIEQEEVVKNLVLGELGKKEAVARSERLEAVNFIYVDCSCCQVDN